MRHQVLRKAVFPTLFRLSSPSFVFALEGVIHEGHATGRSFTAGTGTDAFDLPIMLDIGSFAQDVPP